MIIWNTTTAILKIYDGSQYNDDLTGRFAAEQGFEIPAGSAEIPVVPFTIRGLTNASQVSAIGGGKFSWRTQFFSSNPKTA